MKRWKWSNLIKKILKFKKKKKIAGFKAAGEQTPCPWLNEQAKGSKCQSWMWGLRFSNKVVDIC